jgi:ornithine carbamoyltransferase
MSLQPSPGSPAPVAAMLPCELQGADGESARQRALVCAAVARAALTGREVGLLCDDPSQPEALVAYRAAIELGAHVSLVRPRFEELGESEPMREAVRMLGRLYDAVVCVAIPAAAIEQLRSLAGVPVIVEPAAGLAMVGAAAYPEAEEGRCLSWQAALLAGFASA